MMLNFSSSYTIPVYAIASCTIWNKPIYVSKNLFYKFNVFFVGKLKITLVDAEPNSKAKNKSIGHKRPTVRPRADGTEESVDAHSEIFIIGYR